MTERGRRPLPDFQRSHRRRAGLSGLVFGDRSPLGLAPIAAVVINVFLPSQDHLVSPRVHGLTGLHLEHAAADFLGRDRGVLFRRDLGLARDRLSFSRPRVLEWALVLPLAMPAYVMAYAYTDWLQAAGPVQSLLRELTGWRVREYWFPRSAPCRALRRCCPSRFIPMSICSRALLSWNNRARRWRRPA